MTVLLRPLVSRASRRRQQYTVLNASWEYIISSTLICSTTRGSAFQEASLSLLFVRTIKTLQNAWVGLHLFARKKAKHLIRPLSAPKTYERTQKREHGLKQLLEHQDQGLLEAMDKQEAKERREETAQP